MTISIGDTLKLLDLGLFEEIRGRPKKAAICVEHWLEKKSYVTVVIISYYHLATLLFFLFFSKLTELDR